RLVRSKLVINRWERKTRIQRRLLVRVSGELVSKRLIRNSLIRSKLVSNRLVRSRVIRNRLVCSRLVSRKLVRSKLVSNRLVRSSKLVRSRLVAAMTSHAHGSGTIRVTAWHSGGSL